MELKDVVKEKYGQAALRVGPSGRIYGLDMTDETLAQQAQGKFMSAFIRATKPVACCAPGCCP